MHITSSSLLGIVFLGLSLSATFTMFQFWGYDYDEVNKKSSCPQWKMNIHRALGFAYIIVYVLMMIEMIPRLWEYQVAFSAQTVAHILLGSLIGIILIIKVSIVRFFRHFEEWMPVLGVSLMIASVLLGVMSLPAFYQERALAEGVYSKENRARVARLLPEAGFPEGVDVALLAQEKSLESGRRVLLDKCISCHDLKTVIAKPRTPQDWVRTSDRMVAKPSLAGVITEEEGHRAAAYLIAITPDLQRSAKSKRADQIDRSEVQRAADEILVVDSFDSADAGVSSPAVADVGDKPVLDKPVSDKPVSDKPVKEKPAEPKYDFKEAKALYDDECSLCHETSDVDAAPPTSRKEVNSLLQRMVDNGLDLEKGELALIRYYLVRTFVAK